MSQAPINYDELTELCGAARDEQLTPAQFGRLQALLGADPQARWFYSRFMQLHGLLEQQVCPDVDPVAEADLSLPNVPATPVAASYASRTGRHRLSHRVGRALAGAIEPDRHPFNYGLFAMACLLLCMFGFFALITPDWWGDPRYIATVISDHEPFADDEDRLPPQVARITDRSADREWAASQRDLSPHAHLRMGQRIRLASGFLEITFADGAKVTLEGPAAFQVKSRGAGTLEHGQLAAYVPPAAKGFTVHTDMVSVVDLGTEFGVGVDGDKSVEVATFTGSVELHAAGGPMRFDGGDSLIGAGESVTVTQAPAGGRRAVVRRGTPSSRFTREIPEIRAISVNFHDTSHLGGHLPPRARAGYFAAAHWNNFLTQAEVTGPKILSNLVDSGGGVTSASIGVDSQAGWQLEEVYLKRPNILLENGYWDTGWDEQGNRDDGVITITGLPEAFVESGYYVLVYLHGTDVIEAGGAAEFGARIGDEEYWLRWVGNPVYGTFTRSQMTSEEEAEASSEDDNLLIFDNHGRHYTAGEFTLEVLKDPDGGREDQWARAAVAGIQIVQGQARFGAAD